MPNIKTYQIQINGITESVKAVDALNESLKTLEERINALSSKAVNVSASSGGGTKSSSSSALSEEAKLEQEISKLEEKRIAHSKEIYQNYLAAKDVLKETENDQKQIAAAERMAADTYSNTIQGMKQELADIKSVMQTVDLGDSDKMKQMVDRANELNTKLKEIEQSYGQFGRNVGNYQDAANGFKKLTIEVNGVAREFDNAKQALMTLKKERDTMGVGIGKSTKEFKELDEVVKQLQSDIQDLSKSSAVMDQLLDTMQSFAAIGTISTGFAGLFGFDNAEIEKSIQKMVAFQNILKGIETINKQIQTREGVGAWIAPFNKGIDTATQKLLVYNRALLGTGKAASTAAVGIKVFGKALKGLASLGILLVIDLAIEKFSDLIDTFKSGNSVMEQQKVVQQEVARALGEATGKLAQYQTRVDNFNGTLAEEKKLVGDLNKELGSTFGTYKSLAEWKKVLKERTDAYIQSLVLEAQIQAKLNQLVDAYMRLDEVKQSKNSKWSLYNNFGIGKSYREEFDEVHNQIIALTEDIENLTIQRDKLNKDNKLFDYAPQIEKTGKHTKDVVVEIEKEIAEARLSAMKEGLNKTITQLEKERIERLAKLKKNSNAYKKYEKEINAIYDQRILEARQTWAEQMEQINRDMWHKIYNDTLENVKRQTSLIEQETELQKKALEQQRSSRLHNTLASYGIQGKEQISPITSSYLDIISNSTAPIVEASKKLMDFLRTLKGAENRLLAMQAEYNRRESELTDEQKAEWDRKIQTLTDAYQKALTVYGTYYKQFADEYGADEIDKVFDKLEKESYASSLATQFKQIISETDAYWQQRIELETSQAEKLFKQQKEQRKAEFDAELREAKEHMDELLKQADDYRDKQLDGLKGELTAGLITQDDYNKRILEIEKERNEAIERISDQHWEKVNQITEKYGKDEAQLEYEKTEKIREVNKEAYEQMLQDLRDFQTAIYELEQKQPVINAWGITNFKRTNNNNRKLLEAYEAQTKEIVNQRIRVSDDYNQGLIDDETFKSTLRELDAFAADLGEKMDRVRYELQISTQIGQFIQDINRYVQEGLSAIQTVMDAIADYEDYQFDKLQDALEKENDMLKDKLDEQKDIIEEHKDRVDSIEDELATSRGDRRQHLIDQLNAEILAQRAAMAEEQRIQKLKEANEKKQEALEKKRKQAEYKRNLLSILVSTAMATANGLATQPFVPVGIAMGALATTLGMIQYALAQKAKPYAKGGQLDGGQVVGNRHRDGGVKVLGGRAEVEGGEFITNRISTQMNAPLLEFINSKKKRIDISDLMEFYSSGSIKKNISTVKSKFEDGGYIPVLPNQLDIREQLQNVIINQDNRPIYVSVVDINNKQDDVRRVQTLAGL